MATGAIVAVTSHGGAAGDTTTVFETVIEAGLAVADLIAERTPKGKYEVHPEGVHELVADKGYHSNDVLVGMAELDVRSYVAEPDRGPRNWEGKEAEKAAVYGNRRRIKGDRGKRMQRQRGERIERNFAHQFDSGGPGPAVCTGPGERTQEVPDSGGRVQPRALLLRSTYGSGKPRAAHDRAAEVILMIWAVMKTVEDLLGSASAFFHSLNFVLRLAEAYSRVPSPPEKGGLDTGC